MTGAWITFCLGDQILRSLFDVAAVPRVGDDVRIAEADYVVERVQWLITDSDRMRAAVDLATRVP